MLLAFERAGIVLPRVSREQYHAGAHVPVEQAQPEDLPFWAYDTAAPETIHHPSGSTSATGEGFHPVAPEPLAADAERHWAYRVRCELAR